MPDVSQEMGRVPSLHNLLRPVTSLGETNFRSYRDLNLTHSAAAALKRAARVIGEKCPNTLQTRERRPKAVRLNLGSDQPSGFGQKLGESCVCRGRGGRKIKWEEQCFNEGLAWERDDLLAKFSWLFPGTLMRGFFWTNRPESGECLSSPPALDADGNWKNCPSRVHKTSSFLPPPFRHRLPRAAAKQ